MSHIVEIKTQIRDPGAVAAACQRLGLPAPVQGTFKLFSDTVTGLGVQLDGWRYPVVCDTTTGEVRYDDFEGRWGNKQQLDAFFQRYTVEKAAIEARKRGYTVTEQALADGSIKLTVQVTGGAA